MDNDQRPRQGENTNPDEATSDEPSGEIGRKLSRPNFTEPAASSAENDPNDLPLWLQSFGESTNDAQRADLGGQVAEADLGWAGGGGAQLRRETGFAASASDGSVSTSSFLSDDDLPEWLRALPSTDTPDSSGSTVSAPKAGTLGLPAISRAWVADHDVPGSTSGGMVFASIVQTIDTRPDSRLTSRAIDPEPGADPTRGALDASSTPVASGSLRSQSTRTEAGSTVTMVNDASESAGDTSSARRRMRMYLMAAIIIVILLFLVFVTR